MAALETSLATDGWIGAITVAADGETFDGSARVEKTAENGMLDDTPDVEPLVIKAQPNRPIRIESDGTSPLIHIRTDIPTATDPRAVRLGVAANRIASLNLEWEPDILSSILETDGIDLSALNFTTDEWAEAAMPTLPEAGAGGDEFDATPEDGPTRTSLGQLWSIGGVHRLLVGDCTDPANVARLMGGERAKLTMTSPPYWVGKDYEQEQTWDEIQAFIARCSAVMAEQTTHRIVINTGAPPAARLTGERAHIRLLLDDWQRELKEYGFLMRYVRIWTKRGGLLHTRPESDCIDQHWEFIATFYRPETYEGQRRCGEPWATEGLWEMHGEMSSGGHTAAFPIEIPRRNIILHTDPDDLIYEPFMGSGVTMISAHREGRRCYGCDVTPSIADLCLRRAEAEGLECALLDG